jgi:hypothetical protein
MRVTEVVLEESTNRAHLLVEIDANENWYTSQAPQIAAGILLLFPRLRFKKVYGSGQRFEYEVKDTELPVILMFLILELQSRTVQHGYLSGVTHWNWLREPNGTWHIDMDYEHPQLLIAVIPVAVHIINSLAHYKMEELYISSELKQLRHLLQYQPKLTKEELTIQKRLASIGRIREIRCSGLQNENPFMVNDILDWLYERAQIERIRFSPSEGLLDTETAEADLTDESEVVLPQEKSRIRRWLRTIREKRMSTG